MNFKSSTHCKKWVFTEEQLAECRRKANEEGLQYVKGVRLKYDLPVDNLQPLSTADEAQLVAYHAKLLFHKDIKQHLKLPPKTIATAVTLVKRFYSRSSCMQYDVLPTVMTILFIAGKVSENYIDVERMKEVVKSVRPKSMLSMEPEVLQRLNFDLVVFEPYYCIEAMIDELREAGKAGEPAIRSLLERLPGGSLRDVLKLANSFTDSLLQSDAPLIMSPQQQALCAVVHALKRYGMPEDDVFARYAKLTASDGDTSQVGDALKKLCWRGEKLTELGHQNIDKAQVKQLDTKVRTINPLLDKKSKVYTEQKSSKKKRKRDVNDEEKKPDEAA